MKAAYKNSVKVLMSAGFCLTNYADGISAFRNPVTGETRLVRQSTGRVIG
jgi:hypothetical protein